MEQQRPADTEIPEYVPKPSGYQAGSLVRYKGHIFRAAFWAGQEPGVGSADQNGWRLHKEIYEAKPLSSPMKIIAYLPTWPTGDKVSWDDPKLYKNITHCVIAFLMFDETSPGYFLQRSVDEISPMIKTVVSTGHSHRTSVLIALGGATDYGFLSLMSSIGPNPSHPALSTAVQNVTRFVLDNNLDGVDLDMESWWRTGEGGRKSGSPSAAGQALAIFAKQLRAALPGKLISAAVFATSWYGNNYDASMVDSLDWLSVMTYDLTGSWNQSPVGPHTALRKIEDQSIFDKEQQEVPWPQNETPSENPRADNPITTVEDSILYWSNPFFMNWQGAGQNVPRSKLCPGIPLYGYDFAHPKDNKSEPGYKMVRYSDICREHPGAHVLSDPHIQVPGSTPRVPFSKTRGTYPFKSNIYFESAVSALEKTRFIRSIGCQGVIIWELTAELFDHQSVLGNIYRESGNPPTD